MSSSVTPDRSKSCCCQGMPGSLAHHSLDAMGKFITRPIAAKGLFLEAVDPEKTTRAMNISATSNSSFVDGRFYLYTQLATGISLMILSPITVISNLLLLLTIYKDPLKCFHTPASYLIIALCCVDFTAGLVMEPLFIAYRLASYLKWSLYPGRSYVRLLRIGSSISTIGLNLSFLLVLALIWTQFLAITHPQRYRSAITTRRILVFFGAILIACTLAHIIKLDIWFYTELETPQDTLHLYAAMTIADEMLFIKVAADAFIYAWRLPYYRKSLRKVVLTRAGRQIGNEATEMVTMA